MTTIRLTMAQALVRFLAAQRTIVEGGEVPLFAGAARASYEAATHRQKVVGR